MLSRYVLIEEMGNSKLLIKCCWHLNSGPKCTWVCTNELQSLEMGSIWVSRHWFKHVFACILKGFSSHLQRHEPVPTAAYSPSLILDSQWTRNSKLSWPVVTSTLALFTWSHKSFLYILWDGGSSSETWAHFTWDFSWAPFRVFIEKKISNANNFFLPVLGFI